MIQRVLLRLWRRFGAVKAMPKSEVTIEPPALASRCCDSGGGFGTSFQDSPNPTYALYEALKEACQNNATYFNPDESENGQRLYQGFLGLMDHVDTVWPLVDHVRKAAPAYDFDSKSVGNGYRSFVAVVDSCALHGLKLSRQVCASRDALLFRKGYFVREVEACGQLMASLCTCLRHVHTLLTWAPPGELFPASPRSPEELFAQADTINQYCFYGRCLGFQFLPSMRGILKGISICMAGFSEAYYSSGNLISSVWTGGQYLIDAELRARRIVNISQCADIEFCKAFWFLAESEIMQKVPSLVSSSVSVNKLMSLPPERLTVKRLDGSELAVLPPSVHVGLRSLNVRLISHARRRGMAGEGADGPAPATGIVFHCHGGGFVAQSSKSHEVYLREWAATLDVPILSIDYSLAPDAPFPRALQEVFYAYCWMLTHFDILGTTGERVVLAGDSAGANLIAGCTLKILEAGVRAPEGLFMAYAPLLVSFVPSPARLLCLMDPLLPFGFMMRCLKAYACPPANRSKPGDERENASDSNVSSPLGSNGYLKVSPSQGGASWYEEVSTSDLRAQVSCGAGGRRRSADTTASAASLHSDHTYTGASPEEKQSQQYVADFLDRYRDIQQEPGADEQPGQSESDSSSTLVEDKKGPSEAASKDKKKLQTRFSRAASGLVGAVTGRLTHITTSKQISNTPPDMAVRSNMDALIARSPSDEFIFSVPRDPLLSPYFADEQLLKRFPPVRILSVHLDPCLDDCVMFARKLARLGGAVGLDVLEGLPHGFLNFSLMCKEANEGSKLCVRRIQELMRCEKIPPPDKPAPPGEDVSSTDKHVPATDKHVPATDKHVFSTDKHVPSTEKHVSSTDKHVPATDRSSNSTEEQTPSGSNVPTSSNHL